MSSKKQTLFVFLFIFIVSLLFAFGNREQEADIISVTGTVRLIGSSAFPEIVISGEHEWYVVREEMHKLFDLQHQTVTVEGEEIIKEMIFANGVHAGFRRELKNIKIIAID